MRTRSITPIFAATLLVGSAFFLAPSPSEVDAVPESVRIPMLAPREKGDPPDAARYSHWEHNQYSCNRCHPSVFPKEQLGFTHDEMSEGKFCGSCHNGKRVWDADDDDIECEICHAEGQP